MPPKLRALTLRLEAQAFTMLQEEARRAGIPMSQFIREAAIARALLRQSQRPATDTAMFARVMELAEVRESSGAQQKDDPDAP